MALVFYLIMFQSSGLEISLLVSRDLVVGTLLGLVAMWAIFDRLWAKPAIQEMKEAFADNMRSLGQLNRMLVASSVDTEKVDLLRERINSGFDRMGRNADMVIFEVGGHQAEYLYWRNRLADFQSSQESLFLARLALNHYRFHLSVTEWPASLAQAFRQFNDGLASTWESLAVQMAQMPAPPFHKPPLKKMLADLRSEAIPYFSTLMDENDLHGLEAILDLDEQMVSTTEKLAQEVLITI